jgi:deoxyadenosine/deoxycytidine kinase
MAGKKHYHLAILGNVASGKTTASQLLAEKLKARLIDADLFEENPFLPLYANDRPRWSFATELYFTRARLKKLSDIKILLKSSTVVVDSGLWMSSWVYARNHLKQGTMTAAEWQFYLDLTSDLKKNTYDDEDLIIFMHAPTDVLLKRIDIRGRDFEKAYDKNYLLQLNDRLDELAEKFKSEQKPLLEFDSARYDLRKEKDLDLFVKQVKEKLRSV